MPPDGAPRHFGVDYLGSVRLETGTPTPGLPRVPALWRRGDAPASATVVDNSCHWADATPPAAAESKGEVP
ncbi:MAG TPA: hypothetical protein VHR45_18535 [Thermoanaerobaculia bacterium]|nr:hypothetical protein [Thermoanaerobaculia bacterium]